MKLTKSISINIAARHLEIDSHRVAKLRNGQESGISKADKSRLYNWWIQERQKADEFFKQFEPCRES